MKETEEIRWHHIPNLRDWTKTNPQQRVDHIKKSAFRNPNGILLKNFTHDSAQQISETLDNLAIQRPIVIPTFYSDFFCKNCTGYNGNICTYYTKDDLITADMLTIQHILSPPPKTSFKLHEILECKFPTAQSFYISNSS